ncbi:MAG TPA: nucleoside triphosphate pyrophosphohydrolase [Candidatus Limnocylindrales bacterium]|nr:nucleoside triphosphate pyrophosphohydrolase [Candidatus Limnocylindrales bacterium]
MSTGEKFERALAIMARLRAPGGCPWDREQTFDTIKKYTLEETYEVLEAIENRDWPELTEELGDLLLQVLFYAEMAKEERLFAIDDVLDALSNKLIGRHPHVFGDVKAEDAQQVLKNWEALKKEEKQRKASLNGRAETDANAQESGLLEAVSRKMPALMEAQKISSKAAHIGFDWPDVEGIFEKLAEETNELREHVQQLPQEALAPQGQSKVPPDIQARLEDELGDLFFVLVNLARRLAVDPESALRSTNRKFRQRFGWLERELRSQGRHPEDSTLDEMESLWQQAKTSEEGGR